MELKLERVAQRAGAESISPRSTSRWCRFAVTVLLSKVKHDLIQEGDVVEKLRTSMQSGKSHANARPKGEDDRRRAAAQRVEEGKVR